MLEFFFFLKIVVSFTNQQKAAHIVRSALFVWFSSFFLIYFAIIERVKLLNSYNHVTHIIHKKHGSSSLMI